jgi:hypothetical protein
MDLQIIDKTLAIDIYGFSGIAVNQNYGQTAFGLMDKMWKIVKGNNLKNKGLNIWIYEPGEKVFAGVELDSAPPDGTELEQKNIILTKYAYYKHVGPYQLISKVGQNMRYELKSRGFQVDLPYIEIYGHWENDETKLETELIMSLK